VSIEDLEALLLVQERDTTLDQLRHRRAALPERTQLLDLAADLRARDGEVKELRAQRDAVLAEERRLDDEARSVGAHADEMDQKLYSGAVSSPRELQAMQADVASLRNRRSELEDRELEVMEQREALDAQVGAVEAVLATGFDEVQRLQAFIANAESEIDAEIANEESARSELAASVPPSLVADYERRRAQNRGAGAARLVAATCQACHLSIPSTEAERIVREAGRVVAYCDNCGAILVP
jgi:predicted  nucleic acid-binding Zn-ribbon protein